MTQFSRRRFLEDSLIATTAALAAGSLANSAFAEEKEAQSTSPNEKLAVAVIGVNGRGTSHLGAFAGRKDTEVTIICDADKNVGERRCEEVAKKQDGRKPKFFQDIRQVLEDKSVDIVSIATPNHWHALGAIWAIQAGKDVYVEKPVSHNVWEGRKIVEAARKYGKICQTGTQCRSTDGNKKAMAFMKSGKIGEVKLARALCYKGRGSIGAKGEYAIPEQIDYNLWSGPAPILPLTRSRLHYDWHWQWAYGNGDLGNQGIHQMDVARWGLGVNDLGQNILSFGGRLGYVDAGETANTQVSIHGYGDKTLIFEVRGLKTPDLKGAKVGNIFYGPDGYVVLTSYEGGAAFDNDGKLIEKFGGGGDHFGNFLKAVRSRQHADLAADIEEGHLSSALCHLGNISYRLGETIKVPEVKDRVSGLKMSDAVADTVQRFQEHLAANNLDVEKTEIFFGPQLAIEGERFTGALADRANQQLSREYRAPFVVPEKV